MTSLSLRVAGDDLFAACPLPVGREVIVGRSAVADLDLNHPSVSRQHAVVELLLSGEVRLRDLGSANGTRLDGKPVPVDRWIPLPLGALVEVGHGLLLRVEPTAPPPRSPARAPLVALLDRLERSQDEPVALGAIVVEPAALTALERHLLGALGAGEVLARDTPGRLLLLAPRATERWSALCAAWHRALPRTSRIAPPEVRVVRAPEQGERAERLLARAVLGSDEEAVRMTIALCLPARVERLVALHQKSEAPLLLLGEGGTGKVALGELIHRRSPRARGPLVRFEAAQPRLAEALQQARGGTLIVEELDRLQPAAQRLLLGALGSSAVRLVATSRHGLDDAAARGELDLELRAAFGQAALYLPPLRERGAELATIVERLLVPLADRLGCPRPVPTADAERALAAHHWPGNLLELALCLERGLGYRGAQLEAEWLGLPPVTEPPASAATAGKRVRPRDDEREQILEALARCAGNQSRAAALLGISRGTLVSRLALYDVPRPRGPRRRR